MITAQGMLAERLGLDMGQAFEWLRGQARVQSQRLADLAGAVAGGRSGWRFGGCDRLEVVRSSCAG